MPYLGQAELVVGKSWIVEYIAANTGCIVNVKHWAFQVLSHLVSIMCLNPTGLWLFSSVIFFQTKESNPKAADVIKLNM